MDVGGDMPADEDKRFDAAVAGLKESAERAREQWALAAKTYRAMRAGKGWESVKSLAELTIYLTSLDYNLKVLLHTYHTDVGNRAVWERYLALEVYEAVDAVPKRFGLLLRQKADTSPQRDRYKEANAAFSKTVRSIRDDKVTWELIKKMRNEVTAHHGSKGNDAMLTHVAWALASDENRVKGVKSHRSKVSEYAGSVGRTIQQVGTLLS
jgi:hypothetical protein